MLQKRFAEKKYKKTLFSRYDMEEAVFYFSEKEFPGLRKNKFDFKNGRGERLSGYFFSYEGADESRIIVFDHGLSVGYRSYFREVETLCAAGYTVYTFDHTGCTESEGEGIHGFVGSLSDLDDCITALKKEFPHKPISVVGHSRGGYSTMNIPALHPDIKHAVAISGFPSVKDMHAQLIPAFAKKVRALVYSIEEEDSPKYAGASAIESLKQTDTKVLFIHSADDRVVSKKHYEKLHSALKDVPNISFLLLDGKNHNPHYTADAVKYKDAFFIEYKRRKKKKLLETKEQREAFKSSFDWWKMTEQDDGVWEKIIAHLNS